MKRNGFFILKISITAISFIAAVIAKSNIDWSNLMNNNVDCFLVKEIIYDLSIGVFSSMILVWFIDEISNHIQDYETQEKEKSAIKRFDKVLQLYIDQYVTSFYCVTTPIESRNYGEIKMPEHFTLKDMRDLYQSSALINEKFSNRSVESFLQVELELRKELILLTENNNFEHYPKFADIFSDYIQASLRYDSRSFILDVPNKKLKDQSLTVFVHDILENQADDYYQKLLKGESLEGNIVLPYIFLYEMMKAERNSILQYQNEIYKLS